MQIYVSIMWQTGPQLEFILAAFLSFLIYLVIFLPVSGKTLPPPCMFPSFVFFFSTYSQKKKKKKKKKTAYIW
jgi:hypothetical protein